MQNNMRFTGFTLVELVAVLLLIGVISGLALMAFSGTAEQSRVQATIHEAKKFNDAALAFHAVHGRWPGNDIGGLLPADFAGYLTARDFARQPPCGGIWDWNGPGTSLTKIGISIAFRRNEVPRSICEEIDKAIDDGNLRTGAVDLVRLGQFDYLQFHLDNK